MKKRPPPKKKCIKKADVVKSAVKHDGSLKLMAKELGVAKQTVYYHLQKPEIKEAVNRLKDIAMEKAGITRAKVYQKVCEGLDATKVISSNVIAQDGEGMKDANSMTKDFIEVPDFKERRESAKICLQLFGDLNNDADEGASGKTFINMPVIVLDGKPLNFMVGKHANTAPETS